MSKTKRPVIGIIPSFDEGNNIPAGGDVARMYLRHEYTSNIADVGALPLILNPHMPIESIIELCDGIVISGGEDIEPHLYGEQPMASARFNEPESRYVWEAEVIHACDQATLPILGICYGMQRLNVHYGGTLMQDIATDRPDNIGHDKTVHEVTFRAPFLSMRGKHLVASRHHQAIDRLADGMEIVAEAPDGIIEAVAGYGHFGIQWHPESDKTGIHVYQAFVDYCAGSVK